MNYDLIRKIICLTSIIVPVVVIAAILFGLRKSRSIFSIQTPEKHISNINLVLKNIGVSLSAFINNCVRQPLAVALLYHRTYTLRCRLYFSGIGEAKAIAATRYLIGVRTGQKELETNRGYRPRVNPTW